MHDKELATHFEGGSLVIARLAPQDYHRFHSPVDGKVVSISPVVGKQFWTVNPVAINSPVNVFCENVRRVAVIDSQEFGKVKPINTIQTLQAFVRLPCGSQHPRRPIVNSALVENRHCFTTH